MPFFSPEFFATVLAGFMGLCLGWPALYLIYQKWGWGVFTCLSLLSALGFFVGLYYLYGWFSPPPPPPSFIVPSISPESSSVVMTMMPGDYPRGAKWSGPKVYPVDEIWVYHAVNHYPGLEGRDYDALSNGAVLCKLRGAKVVFEERVGPAPISMAFPVGLGLTVGVLFGIWSSFEVGYPFAW